MADLLYPKGAQHILNKTIDFDTDTIKVTLVNTTTDSPYNAAHDYFDDITDYLGVTPQTITNATITDGVFDSPDTVTFSSVAIDGVKDVEALVIYRDSGVAATSELVAFIDITTPITPNGGDITITWNASGIFSIA